MAMRKFWMNLMSSQVNLINLIRAVRKIDGCIRQGDQTYRCAWMDGNYMPIMNASLHWLLIVNYRVCQTFEGLQTCS